jgi:tRNA A-37 threonylcarbamoyl transferase component Bud32
MGSRSGNILGPWLLTELLGEGGHAQVYAAQHVGDRRLAAIKVQRVGATLARDRLVGEIQVLLRLAPHRLDRIVQTFDAQTDGDDPWLAMERLRPHHPLRANGKISWPLARRLMRAVLEALASIHAHRIAHGDISPRNIMFRGRQPVLIDFGNAFEAVSSGRERLGAVTDANTVSYAAPERLRGESFDGRVDLYAAGCLFYELLYGRPVFSSDAAQSVAQQHLFKSPSFPVPRVRCPDSALALVRALLEKDPRQRPGSALQALTVLAGSDRRPGRTSAPVLPLAQRPPFVGRAGVIATLRSQAVRASEGHTQVSFVVGESGIGKTRLMNELSTEWVRSGFRVIALGCEPSEETRAAGPRALDVFRPLIAQFSAEEREQLLLASSETQRIRTFVNGLHQLTRSQAVVMVIDDVQWADALSHQVLRSAWLLTRKMKLLVIATCRKEELPQALGDVEALVLDRLSLAEVSAIVTQCLGSDAATSEWVDFLFAHSEGNPFFLTEYISILGREGLRLEALPPSIAALFEQRFNRLAPDARTLLCRLAMFGREGPLRGVDISSDWEALEAFGFVERVAQTYRFTHDKWREAALSRIPGDERPALHRALAEQLECEPDADPGLLGWHWAQARLPARAYPLLRAAAEAASLSYSPQRAADLYREAITEAHILNRPEFERCELWEARSDALIKLARHEDARAAFGQALSLTSESLVRARLHRKRAASFWTVHAFAASRVEIEAALAELGEPRSAAEHEEWIEIQLNALEMLYFSRKGGAEAKQLVETVNGQIELHGTPVQRCRHYVTAATELMARSRYFGGVVEQELGARALALAEEVGEPPLIAMTAFCVGFQALLPCSRRLDRAVVCLERARQLAEEVGDLSLTARVSTYLAITARRRLDLEGCRVLAQQARVVSERARFPQYVSACLACLAWVALKENDVPRCAELIVEAKHHRQRSSYEFPFYWVLDFVDLAMAGDDAVNVAAIATRLLHAQQQRLEPSLERSLTGLTQAQTLEPRGLGQLLRTVLLESCELGYL